MLALLKSLRKRKHQKKDYPPRVLNDEAQLLQLASADSPLAPVLRTRGSPRKSTSESNNSPSGALSIAHDLHVALEELQLLGLIDEGLGKVDFEGLGNNVLWRFYLEQACQLQSESLAFASTNEAKSFWVTIYNSLTIHGLIEAARSRTKGSLDLEDIAYCIAGETFTLDDIEHGILRANRPHPANADEHTNYFPQDDTRRRYSLPKRDPRIHFVLACPALRFYDPNTIDHALNAAASAFCAQGIEVDGRARKVTIPKLFHCYAMDFGETTYEVLEWVLRHLPPGPATILQGLLGAWVISMPKLVYQKHNSGRSPVMARSLPVGDVTPVGAAQRRMSEPDLMGVNKQPLCKTSRSFSVSEELCWAC